LADSRVSEPGLVLRACHENRRRRVRPWISSTDVTSRTSRKETTRGAVSRQAAPAGSRNDGSDTTILATGTHICPT